MRMQRRKQPGAAGAEDQNVGLEAFERSCRIFKTRARAKMKPTTAETAGRRGRGLLLSVAPVEVLDHQQPQPA